MKEGANERESWVRSLTIAGDRPLVPLEGASSPSSAGTSTGTTSLLLPWKFPLSSPAWSWMTFYLLVPA